MSELRLGLLEALDALDVVGVVSELFLFLDVLGVVAAVSELNLVLRVVPYDDVVGVGSDVFLVLGTLVGLAGLLDAGVDAAEPVALLAGVVTFELGTLGSKKVESS